MKLFNSSKNWVESQVLFNGYHLLSDALRKSILIKLDSTYILRKLSTPLLLTSFKQENILNKEHTNSSSLIKYKYLSTLQRFR
jgi:hypothetical protein